ncbi:MAG: hypothetical protein R3Y59_03180 [bacterium]
MNGVRFFLIQLLLFATALNTYLLAESRVADTQCDSVARAELKVYRNTTDTLHLQNAMEYIECIEDMILKGDVFYVNGQVEIESGAVRVGHQLIQQAINNYRLDGGDKATMRESACHYLLSIHFVSQVDASGLTTELENLKQLHEENLHLPSIQFDYYSVMAINASFVYDENEDPKELENMLSFSRKAIEGLEQLTPTEWDQLGINPCWVYFNMALFFDIYHDPVVTDSVFHYLHLTEDALSKFIALDKYKKEVEISIHDLYAWCYLETEEFDKAVDEMNYVVMLLDSIELVSPNSVIAERGEAYAFFIELYEIMGEYEKALEYQKLLTENNFIRYDLGRNSALKELQIEFDVANKEAEINLLSEQNKVLRLLVIVTLVIFLLLILIFILIKLYNKNKEQKLYEAALIADSKNESEKITIQIIFDKLRADFPIHQSQFDTVNMEQLVKLLDESIISLSTMDKKYIICFIAAIKPAEIALMFNVEPASVYTVKYRIKKKFSAGILPF